VNTAVDFALQQSRGFQHAQVFRNGRQGNAKRLGKLGDHRLALRQAGQNGAARGIGKRAKGSVQGCAGIFNHSV
jgi:hypothetical protein